MTASFRPTPFAFRVLLAVSLLGIAPNVHSSELLKCVSDYFQRSTHELDTSDQRKAEAAYLERLETADPQSQPKDELRSQLWVALDSLLDSERALSKTGKKYLPVPMRKDFVGESIGIDRYSEEHGLKARYTRYLMKPAEREEFRVKIDPHRILRNSAGEPLNGHYIFVMDQDGNLYAHIALETGQRPPTEGRFHHSSFLAGEPVSAAGELFVNQGVISAITGRSGHYAPDAEINLQILEQLRREGIAASQIEYRRY